MTPEQLNLRMSPPFFLVFSDLDGTLLDHNTYGWKEAVPALELCRTRGVPVILASSKTRAEMDVLRRRLSLSAPFISENGGGIFFPEETSKDPSPESSNADIPAFSPGGLYGVFCLQREWLMDIVSWSFL